MAENTPEARLPSHIPERASVRGGEYAWPLANIPHVIEAARGANLVNMGGQLQFRLPEGAVCECYWVETDTYKCVPESLPWPDRVARAAETALAQFRALEERFDFIAEGKIDFSEHLREAETKGISIQEAMCFVCYFASEDDEAKRS